MKQAMKKSIVVAAAAISLAVFGTVDEATFKSPPRRFAPHVWWHWMNGNISKEGITGDLVGGRVCPHWWYAKISLAELIS